MPPGRVTGLLLVALLMSGALGMPFPHGEVPFESVDRAHFTALGVTRERAEPSPVPLTLRVKPLGDGADYDFDEAQRWLFEHANIRVVEDPRGAPLFLTRADLAATSGRSTLGATVPHGMAVEVSNPRVAPCVIAHEILHFVGLKHVDDPRNVMYPHCGKDTLKHAQLASGQLAQIDTLRNIVASTPTGVQRWATREG